MSVLEVLQRVNPHIVIENVRSKTFSLYGKRYENFDAKTLIDRCIETAVVPHEGSVYIPSLEELEVLPELETLRTGCFGQLEIQCGVCMGQNSLMNALEYHKSSEINIAVSDLVLLLADVRDVDSENRLDARTVKAFYLEKGDVVELYATTLHFCPCGAGKSFFAIVILPRGTNTPLANEVKNAEPLLWARNKWLLAHEDNSALIRRGAHAGIYNENWSIYPV